MVTTTLSILAHLAIRSPKETWVRPKLRPWATCSPCLHLALATTPMTASRRRDAVFDRQRCLERLGRIERAVEHARHAGGPAAEGVAIYLAGQRAAVTAGPPRASTGVRAKDCQVVHGDIQEGNLFFDASPSGDVAISAVIDWDQAYLAPRALEIVRAIDLSFGFSTLVRPFLAAYRATTNISWDELNAAASAYSMMRTYDLWLVARVYLRGERRSRPFLRTGLFRPVLLRWQDLYVTLTT